MRLFILALGSSICFSGVTFAQSTDGEIVSIQNNDAATASDLSTRQQLLSVKPLDWDATRGAGLRTDATPEPESVNPALESVGRAGGGMPSPGADNEASKTFPNQWEGLRSKDQDRIRSKNRLEKLGGDGGPETLGTKDIFSQYCENCSGVNLRHPMKAVGKLFSNSGSCTASVISKNNIIVTAAHCCYNRSANKWTGGWRFAPAYRDGYSPYGLFNWQSANILSRWRTVGDRKSDVCVIKLRKNSQNRSVTYYTGWLGRSWNHGTKQVMHWLGYPGNIGAGNKLELCVSESFNPSGSCGGTRVLNAGCSMTYGASGGPAIRGYRNGNWVNSVVSGTDGASCTGTFGKTFNGPRFTSDNIVKLCNTIGC